ncbi:MAG TPA: GAF domain-containing protein [Anaerolineae bacterium]|nr:GAF domain-containing protein [Anaerolineae bacterium]
MSIPAMLSRPDSSIPQPGQFGLVTRLLNRLRLGRRLALGFGLLVVLSLIFGIVAFITTVIKGSAVEAVLETDNQIIAAEDVLAEFSLARLNERHFLLSYPNQGIEVASQAYVPLTRQHIETTLDRVAEQRASELDEVEPDSETLENLDAIDSILTAYAAGFNQLISAVEQKGFKDSGLEGSFRESIHALEEAPAFQADPELLVLLLQLRRHEKDWLLRHDLADAAVVNDFGVRLKRQIGGSDLSGVEAARLRTLVDQYLADFNNLVKVDQQVFQKTDTLDQISSPLAPLLEEIISEESQERADALADFERLEYISQVVNVGLQAAILVLGVGFAVIVTRSITEPLFHLVWTAHRATAGELTAQAWVVSSDEVGELAEAFNRMTARVRELVDSLESQVQARTVDLALSIEVGQRAAAVRELDDLLPMITDFIKERFELYYAHIYFVDDLGHNLVIQYGTGYVGQALMARRHMLPIGPGSIVGQVAATKQSIVVPDTERSEIHKPNDLLPKTRSEVAVPLVVEGQVIGVLDMQSDQANTFTVDNLAVFEAMGTQLALSINSARQWASAQEAQQKLQETLQQLTGKAWTESLRGRREKPAFTYDLNTVKPLSAKISTGDAVSVPVKIQNQAIGQLAVSSPPNRQLSTDEQALLAAVAQQLGQKAENIRLFEQTQQRAAREQLARQITDKMREAPDMEAIIQTGIAELAKVLNVPRAYVKLTSGLTEELEPPDDREKRPDLTEEND